MACPNSAGMVPSTGSTRTRKPGSAPSASHTRVGGAPPPPPPPPPGAPPDSAAATASGSGSSLTRGASDEYTHVMPLMSAPAAAPAAVGLLAALPGEEDEEEEVGLAAAGSSSPPAAGAPAPAAHAGPPDVPPSAVRSACAPYAVATRRSCMRSDTASGSRRTSIRSPTHSRVGSALPPAPSELMTRMPRAAQKASSAALVSTSSMQSSTKSGACAPPPSSSSSAAQAPSNSRCTGSTAQRGMKPRMARASAATLGVPTSARAALAWRFSDDSDTLSKSTSRSRATPARASMCAAWLPTPPTPTTTTAARSMAASPASPKKAAWRESCSTT